MLWHRLWILLPVALIGLVIQGELSGAFYALMLFGITLFIGFAIADIVRAIGRFLRPSVNVYVVRPEDVEEWPVIEHREHRDPTRPRAGE
jgi:hypothetical protein